MAIEYVTLLKSQTWTLIPPPSQINIICCIWIFKLKYQPDGNIDCYKARSVAKGFIQT